MAPEKFSLGNTHVFHVFRMPNHSLALGRQPSYIHEVRVAYAALVRGSSLSRSFDISLSFGFVFQSNHRTNEEDSIFFHIHLRLW